MNDDIDEQQLIAQYRAIVTRAEWLASMDALNLPYKRAEWIDSLGLIQRDAPAQETPENADKSGEGASDGTS